jgi:hypothetical protein
MPSSPGYVRNYKEEEKTAKARGETGAGHDSGDATRHRARRQALKLGLVKPKQDLDHKKPLGKGGANTPSNYRAESVHANRSYPRNPDGSMKANHEATKPGHDKK